MYTVQGHVSKIAPFES